MKRTTATLLLCLLFSTALVTGKSPSGVPAAEGYPDSLRSVWLYTEGIKQQTIARDSLRARELFQAAIRHDSTYAPAYYELATNGMFSSPDEAVGLARTAYRLDSTNRWYHQFYGQMLLYAQRYGEALDVYRRLTTDNPKDPDNYRLLAALYEQQQEPYIALATLDSAEMRFGRIPLLSAMKRRLLITTKQTDKAIAEAKALVESAPYDAEHHVALAELYAISNKDSLARASYDRAIQADSTDVNTLMSLADFYNDRHDFRALLAVNKRLFQSDALPLDAKVRRFEVLTSDTRFYREYYPQLNDLATTLAIRYPNDKPVVELFGKHLIASGELDRALELYKLHTRDVPPVEDYYRWVIDIESYRQRPDSVNLYVNRALTLFPERIDFHMAKGNVLNYSGKHPEAIRAYRESLRFATTDSLRSAIWGLIGDAWHQKAESTLSDTTARKTPVNGLAGATGAARKAMKECYKAYERSLAYNKDNVLVLNNYAYFLSLDGQYLEKALAMASRAIALSASNPTYLDTYAWVLFQLGRTAEARKIMQQAIALDRQKNSELMLHYGDILEALGERSMAETYWRKALENGADADQISRRFEAVPAQKEE